MPWRNELFQIVLKVFAFRLQAYLQFQIDNEIELIVFRVVVLPFGLRLCFYAMNVLNGCGRNYFGTIGATFTFI